MPGDCPAVAASAALRLWKTFRSKPNPIPVDETRVFAFPPERCSPSDRNAVRNHSGMVFGFRPESRSPSTGFRNPAQPWSCSIPTCRIASIPNAVISELLSPTAHCFLHKHSTGHQNSSPFLAEGREPRARRRGATWRISPTNMSLAQCRGRREIEKGRRKARHN